MAAGHYSPSQVKAYNNKTFAFWERALFQRACSVIKIENIPEQWKGEVKDFMYYCLFRFGYIGIFDTARYGLTFQPGTLSGYNIYYQPRQFKVSNGLLFTRSFTIGKSCEIVKLTPDYMGVWDIIEYYAEKLSSLDNAINMSIINSKIAYIIGAKNKGAAEALKKILDKVNKGEPTVIFDSRILNDPASKDSPFQVFERKSIKDSYLTTEQLMDFQTLLNMFDTEIGIPTVPYQKKERMVRDEANSKQIDATARSIIWLNTMTESIDKVNKMFDTDIKVSLRFNPDNMLQEGNYNNEYR